MLSTLPQAAREHRGSAFVERRPAKVHLGPRGVLLGWTTVSSANTHALSWQHNVGFHQVLGLPGTSSHSDEKVPQLPPRFKSGQNGK